MCKSPPGGKLPMLADRFLAPVRRRPRLPLPLSVLAVWLLAALAAPAVLASGTAAPVALFVLLPPLVFLVLLATSARVQRFVAGLDLRLLTLAQSGRVVGAALLVLLAVGTLPADRKSTRLNSSHEWISYAVFCLKK